MDVSALLAAAERARLPLDVLDVECGEIRAPYRHKLLLSRPDQHVAWRADEPPADPEALIDLIRGAVRRPKTPTMAPGALQQES